MGTIDVVLHGMVWSQWGRYIPGDMVFGRNDTSFPLFIIVALPAHIVNYS